MNSLLNIGSSSTLLALVGHSEDKPHGTEASFSRALSTAATMSVPDH